MPRRGRNAELRTREYLTPDEVEQLQRAAASVGRHGHRDATLIMLAYRTAFVSRSSSRFDGIRST